MNFNTSAKEIYNLLISDNTILNIYTEIEQMETESGGIAFHNFEHIKNVSKTAEKILFDLNFDEEIIYQCKLACLLHDIGALEGKENHALRSFYYAENLFKDKNWIFEGANNVLDAIKNHSSGFETDNIITLAIILADKLDIKKTRISKAGMEIEGNRQYAHIDDIIINIQNNNLIINFISDGKINMKEINNYYFTTKVFKSIEAFSKKLNLKYLILMDNNVWEL